MYKLTITKVAKWILVPFAIIFVALLFSLAFFFNSDINPNILPFNHPTTNIINNNGIISGRFTAAENYLGIISVRFDKTTSLSGNSIFRIKNVLDKDWYHVATISATQYNAFPQYSFGIPVIAKSKKQSYQFEIYISNNDSLNSSRLNLSSKYPVLISQYAFPKSILVQNKNLLFEFIYKKISYYAREESSRSVLMVYSIPLVLYFFYLIFKNSLRNSMPILRIKDELIHILKPYSSLVLFFIFIDIFIIRKGQGFNIFLFIFLWTLGLIAYRFKSHHSFFISFIFLTFCPFLLLANMSWIVEKSAMWAYIFLTVGTMHLMLEMKTNESSMVNNIFNSFSSLLSFIMVIDTFFITFIRDVEKFALFSIRNFIKFLFAFIVVTALFVAGFDFYLKAMSYRDRQLKNPRISQIEPTIAYPSTKIIIYGDSFGDGSNGKYALMKDGVKIRPDYWEDHKIIFTVPLNWKTGSIEVWIQKPVEWNAETVIEKTEPISIQLLKVTGEFTSNDDLYFEQLKKWRKETREINGYE